MKASDLRIGNWIEVFYGSGNKLYQQVDFISENLIECKPNLNIYGNTINYKPIPLTEEWLLKLGFSNLKQPNKRYFKHGKISGGLFLGANYCNYKYTNIIIDITSVHQLQNLYFAITGEELKTK